MTATFKAELIFGSNAEEAAAAAVRASDTMSKAQINAQQKIAATIARGDPLKALQVQHFRELKEVYELERKKTISVQQAEQARKQLVEKFAKERLAIEQQTATQVRQISASTVAANGDLERSARQLKTSIGDVGQAVNAVGSAFGGMGGQAVQAGQSIVGAFGAGGFVGVALAATAVGISVVAGRWRDVKAAADEAGRAAKQASEDLLKAAGADLDAARAALARANPAAAGAEAAEAAARARATLESSPVVGRLGANRAILAQEEERTRADARLRNALLASNAAPLDEAAFAEREAARAARSALGTSPTEAELERVRGEVREAEQLIAKLGESKATWERVAEAERKADAEKGSSRAGSAVLAQQKLEEGRRRKAMAMGRAGAERLGSRDDLIAATRETMEFDIPEIADREREQRGAAVDARFAELRQVTPERLGRIASDFDAEAEKGALLGFAEFGVRAADAFLSGIDSVMKAKGPKEFAQGLLGMLPGALSLLGDFGAAIPGVGLIAGGAKLLGNVIGRFDRGGSPFAFSFPQGRDGLAMMPGGADGKPAIFHPGEVVMRADVASSFPGGFGQAVRVGMGLEPLPTGGRTEQHVHLHQSFAPTETRAAYQQHLAPAMAQTFDDRQAGLVRSAFSRAVAEPRSV